MLGEPFYGADAQRGMLWTCIACGEKITLLTDREPPLPWDEALRQTWAEPQHIPGRGRALKAGS